jgi:MFS family permease
MKGVAMADAQNAFQRAANGKKMLTLVGIYIGLVAQLMTSVTFSGWLRTAQLEFTDGSLYIFAMSIGGVLGIIAMPLFGYFGAKNPAVKRALITISLLIGTVVLLGRGVAPNMTVIAAVSAFWGFVSAGIYVLGFTVIKDMFDQSKAGVYLGLVGTMISIGMIIGPVVGGMIMQSPIGWRGMNIILAACMAIATICVFLGVKVTKDEVKELAVPATNFDVLGTIGMMLLLGGLIVALSMTTLIPLGTPVSWLLLAIAAVGLLVLIVDMRKKGDAAIIPPKIFSDRNSVLLAIIVGLSMITSMSLSIFLPQYIPALAADPIIQAIDPETRGVSLLLPTACVAVAGLFMGPIFGKMIAKAGNARTVTTIATIIQLAIFGAFIALFYGVLGTDAAGNAKVPYIAVLVLMLLGGLYNSRNSVLSAAGQIQIRPEIRQQAHSIVQVGQNLGGGIAMPIFGLIQASFAISFIEQGMASNVAGVAALPQTMPVVMVLVFVLSIPLLILGLMLKPLKKDDEKPKD